jgi:hypothetical protein
MAKFDQPIVRRTGGKGQAMQRGGEEWVGTPLRRSYTPILADLMVGEWCNSGSGLIAFKRATLG